jgi:ubiquinone/menaquinone biosynthesis C-methylase UbiE
MNLTIRLLNQCSKPSGWLGRVNLWSMNRRHSKVTAWGLKHVSIRNQDTILDVGCGGGRTVARLAAMATEGKTYGIDYSEESVAASRRTNRKQIAAGRVEILSGSVSHLPLADRTFDLVTAVETHYYWPDFNADMREILRVLKPGGALIIIAEAYKGRQIRSAAPKARKIARDDELCTPQRQRAQRALHKGRLFRYSGV